jgi:hypothetical protein
VAVRNECFSQLRRLRRDEASALSLLSPRNGQGSIEEKLTLERALRALSPEQREVVHLKVYEGRTFDEIATATGVSINTAASRYRYALETAPYAGRRREETVSDDPDLEELLRRYEPCRRPRAAPRLGLVQAVPAGETCPGWPWRPRWLGVRLHDATARVEER